MYRYKLPRAVSSRLKIAVELVAQEHAAQITGQTPE
jgi:hypothetical protein